MAVAAITMAEDFESFARQVMRKVGKSEKATKYFGKCEMLDGSTSVLVVKARDPLEASRKLHACYKIECVLDILTEPQMQKEWAKIKPSLIQRSQLK